MTMHLQWRDAWAKEEGPFGRNFDRGERSSGTGDCQNARQNKGKMIVTNRLPRLANVTLSYAAGGGSKGGGWRLVGQPANNGHFIGRKGLENTCCTSGVIRRIYSA